MNKIEQAQKMAHEAHDSIGQKRKYTGEPYWVHTDAVASIVSSVTSDEDMIAAAHLHDVLEDVFPILNGWNYRRIEETFGSRVAEMVLDLTDSYTKEACPNLNRAARKAKELERISKISVEAKTIKLADLLDNTVSIVSYDKDFAKVYLREKLAMLPYLSDGNSELLQRCSVQTIAACAAVGIHIPTFSA
jgi:(p)ppGpp synthase/HD superfamily hydrolase